MSPIPCHYLPLIWYETHSLCRNTTDDCAADVVSAAAELLFPPGTDNVLEKLSDEFNVSELFRPVDGAGLAYVPPALAVGGDLQQLHILFT